MFNTLTKTLVIATIAIVSAGAPVGAFARDTSSASKAGATKIKIEDLCVREKNQVCHWEGNRHICVWVDGPNCAIV